jgi:hypothetical protein
MQNTTTPILRPKSEAREFGTRTGLVNVDAGASEVAVHLDIAPELEAAGLTHRGEIPINTPCDDLMLRVYVNWLYTGNLCVKYETPADGPLDPAGEDQEYVLLAELLNFGLGVQEPANAASSTFVDVVTAAFVQRLEEKGKEVRPGIRCLNERDLQAESCERRCSG